MWLVFPYFQTLSQLNWPDLTKTCFDAFKRHENSRSIATRWLETFTFSCRIQSNLLCGSKSFMHHRQELADTQKLRRVNNTEWLTCSIKGPKKKEDGWEHGTAFVENFILPPWRRDKSSSQREINLEWGKETIQLFMPSTLKFKFTEGFASSDVYWTPSSFSFGGLVYAPLKSRSSTGGAPDAQSRSRHHWKDVSNGCGERRTQLVLK